MPPRPCYHHCLIPILRPTHRIGNTRFKYNWYNFVRSFVVLRVHECFWNFWQWMLKLCQLDTPEHLLRKHYYLLHFTIHVFSVKFRFVSTIRMSLLPQTKYCSLLQSYCIHLIVKSHLLLNCINFSPKSISSIWDNLSYDIGFLQASAFWFSGVLNNCFQKIVFFSIRAVKIRDKLCTSLLFYVYYYRLQLIRNYLQCVDVRMPSECW